jgi:hypothetical protein
LKWAAGRTYFMRNGMTFAVNVMQWHNKMKLSVITWMRNTAAVVCELIVEQRLLWLKSHEKDGSVTWKFGRSWFDFPICLMFNIFRLWNLPMEVRMNCFPFILMTINPQRGDCFWFFIITDPWKLNLNHLTSEDAFDDQIWMLIVFSDGSEDSILISVRRLCQFKTILRSHIATAIFNTNLFEMPPKPENPQFLHFNEGTF